MSGVVGLFYDSWEDARGRPVSWRRPWLLWRKAMYVKANPRDAEYMRSRLREKHPDGLFLDVGAEREWVKRVRDAEVVLLLYPDATGVGFGPIERQLNCAASDTEIRVLNGRGRSFTLDPRSRRRLLLRRFLEGTMLGEIVMGLGILVATPVLLTMDFARGRR